MKLRKTVEHRTADGQKQRTEWHCELPARELAVFVALLLIFAGGDTARLLSFVENLGALLR